MGSANASSTSNQSEVVADGLAPEEISVIMAHRYRGTSMGGMVARLRGAVAAGMAMVTPAIAQAQSLAADPQGSGPIVKAVQWLQGTLLGTIATVVAVIAVACVGFLMLSGRLNWRYGAIVILGCFSLLGAASIVAGIRSTAMMGG